MTAPVHIDGLWWPADDTCARRIILADCDRDISAMLAHAEGRACIVQAGANVGVYPLALAKRFDLVLTVEPDPTNYACFLRNVEGNPLSPRIVHGHAAFGEKPGKCAPVEVSQGNCGAHRVDYATGDVGVITIDAMVRMFSPDACDAIWLDVEGAELPALKGAEDTIERFSPVLRVEDKGLHRAFGIPDGELQRWLAERGYQETARVGRDKVFNRRT